MSLLSYATAAGGLAFNTASSFVFRADASTSANGATNSANSAASTSKSTPSAVQSQRRPGHRRRPSQLPSANSPGRSSLENGGGRNSAKNRSRSGQSPHRNGCLPDNSSGRVTVYDGDKRAAIEQVDKINQEEDLYKILGVGRKVKPEEIRRAFLGKSRICHPDKLPEYAPATPAFQRLSYAYETLSKPASRRMYDLGGGRPLEPGVPRDAPTGDETLNGVLRNVFSEFMAGDFEMIRVFVTALNEGNPGLNLGDEAVDSIEGAFKRVREVLLSGQKYLRIIKFELIRLYEIQHSLRSLGYFDLIGRLRLTLALTRVTLEIPMVLDRAMRDEIVSPRQPSSAAVPKEEEEGMTSSEPPLKGQSGEIASRGLLGPRVKGVLVLACRVLEKGEKFGT